MKEKISYERLLEIATKMHLYIFLSADNEQAVYDELGLTNEESKILGYTGQYFIKESDKQ